MMTMDRNDVFIVSDENQVSGSPNACCFREENKSRLTKSKCSVKHRRRLMYRKNNQFVNSKTFDIHEVVDAENNAMNSQLNISEPTNFKKLQGFDFSYSCNITNNQCFRVASEPMMENMEWSKMQIMRSISFGNEGEGHQFDFSPSAVMQKTDPGSILSPKWKSFMSSKRQAISKRIAFGAKKSHSCSVSWCSEGQGIWSNMGGRSIELEETDLLRLSESECDALQDVALRQLNKIDLGVALSIPKDEFKMMKQKASFMKKYGLAAGHNKSKAKDTTHVFGIPLVRVVENDQLLRLQTQADEVGDTISKSNEVSPKCSTNVSRCSTPESVTDKNSHESDQLTSTSTPPSSPKQSPKSGRSSSGRQTLGKPLQRRRAIAASSLDEIDPSQSRLLEALVGTGSREKKLSLIPHTMLQVPYVVQKCCDHILKHGLHVVGVFRVAGSKKRVKQLQEEFDRGVDVQVEDDYNPHDVSALLKEFIRDLPEALLTRTLYSAFISVTKLPDYLRLPSLQCLVWLLPIPNRDTLYSLLSFLHTVAENAEDTTNEEGETIPGNKMNVSNLATIFGPNILHRNKKSKDSSSESHYQVQSADRAEESTLVINVIQEMIVNYKQLFLIPSEVHDDMLRTLKERDPDAVDFLLRRKAGSHMRERSKEFGEKISDDENASDDTFTDDLRNADVTTISEVIDPCQSQTMSRNNSNVEESPSMVTLPRNSYQRATGHLVTPETHHYFAKKTSKQSRNVNLTVNTSSSGKENDAMTSPDSISVSRGSSVIYSPSFFEGRSVSFSEEDLKEILQSNIEESKTRKLSQVNEECEESYHANTHTATICEDAFENAFEQYYVPHKNSDSAGTRRRGGFSVKPADSGLGSSASLASNATDASPRLQRNEEERLLQNVPKIYEDDIDETKDNNNNKGQTEHVFPNHLAKTCSIDKDDLRSSTEDSDNFVKHARKKRLPSGLNLHLHGKYFSNIDASQPNTNMNVSRSMTFTSSLSNRRRSKDDMFAPSPTTFRHHSGSIGHQRHDNNRKEEIPAKIEIEKWKAWNNSNVKPAKLHSRTREHIFMN